MIASVPRDSGRNWHTDMVKPEKSCGLAPAISAESVAKWNWISGVFDCGSARVNKPDEPRQGKQTPRPKPSLSEEALRIIAGYANDLREIIKKLRQRLH